MRQTALQLIEIPEVKSRIIGMLPKNINPDRFLQIVFTELRNNPRLQECEPGSVLLSVSKAARFGLELGADLGQAYLIPRKGICQMQTGYKGWIRLVMRSNPDITNIFAEAVYDDDEFLCEMGTRPKIKHVPGKIRKEVISFYAVCIIKGNSVPTFTMMTKAQVEEHRDKYSADPKGKAWGDSFDEMAKKTVMKKLIKNMPVAIEDPDAYQVQREEIPELPALPVVNPSQFQAISAAPDLPNEDDKNAYLQQMSQLIVACQQKQIDIKDILHEDYKKLPNASLIALISILKERINGASQG